MRHLPIGKGMLLAKSRGRNCQLRGVSVLQRLRLSDENASDFAGSARESLCSGKLELHQMFRKILRKNDKCDYIE
jgi:hypothetical protein